MGSTASVSSDGHLQLQVVPNEAQVVVVPTEAGTGSCSVSITAGAPGKPLCHSAGNAPNTVFVVPLNHAGGSREALPVTWSNGLNWSVNAPELRLSGSGASTTGGATVQRGCVTLKTSPNGTGALLSITVPSSGNKSAVVIADVSTTLGGSDAVDETFTHAGDESVTKFSFAPSAAIDNGQSGQKQRPPSAPNTNADARRRKARVSIMDELAQYNGDVDILSKRFHGRGALNVATGSSSTAKYDGEWNDSLRHGAARNTWCVSLPGTNGAIGGASSVEYTGPFGNDARHGKSGRLTIRKSGGEGGGGGVHIDADWEHGELDGQVTLSTVQDTQCVAQCSFTAGSLAPNVTLLFPCGAFVAKWSNPKTVAAAAATMAASFNGTTSAVPAPLELLQHNTSNVVAHLTKAADAVGAVDCALQSIANPLLADQIRGPVAEVLGSRLACVLSKLYGAAAIVKAQHASREHHLDTVRSAVKAAQSRLVEQEQLISKAEKKRAGYIAERDKAASALEKLQTQRDAAAAALESAENGSQGGDKVKLAQQSVRALAAEKASLDQHISELNDQLASLKAEAKKISQKKDASIKELKAIDAELAQLAEKLSSIDALIDAQVSKASGIDAEAHAAQAKLEASKQTASDHLAELQRQLASASGDASQEGAGPSAQLPSASESVEGTIKEIKQSIVQLKKDIEALEQDKASEEQRAHALSKKGASVMKLRSEMQAELQRLTEGVEASKVSMISKREEIEAMGATLAELQRSLTEGVGAQDDDPDEHVKERHQLESVLQALHEALSKGRSSMTSKMSELDRLRLVVTQLAAEVEDSKRIAMIPPDVERDVVGVEKKRLVRSPPPAPPPVRAATPPPDPRIAELEEMIKASISKQDGLRRKKENIVDRIDQLTKQKKSLESKVERRAREDADEALRASTHNHNNAVSQSQDGGLTAMVMEGSIPELKALLSKMKDQNGQYESENEALRKKLDAMSQAVSEAKKSANTMPPLQMQGSNGVDWRTKALQDEVDAREARISSLRSELKRTNLLEAKIQTAKESIKTLTQSAELRQTQAVQMAKAEMDWTASVTLARKASSSGRNAFF